MLRRSNHLGFSVYPSTWMNVKEKLSSVSIGESYVFTSLHIQEEANQPGYREIAEKMLDDLKQLGFLIIADVSKRTLEYFACNTLEELVEKYRIDVLRIDFGFTDDEIVQLAQTMPVCINASTIEDDLLDRLSRVTHKVFAMHNFYPRPETGLDKEQFEEKNRKLRESNIEVIAFIPSDENLRKPLFEGLPTLENHRNLPPYVNYVDMVCTYGLSMIFIGDGVCSNEQIQLIDQFNQTDVISLPAHFHDHFEYLYGKSFTIRHDSPKTLKRLYESRIYATVGELMEPYNTVVRFRGSITMDNHRYLRYSGEIQIPTIHYPEDERVNVIGHVDKRYDSLLDFISNNSKIQFIRL